MVLIPQTSIFSWRFEKKYLIFPSNIRRQNFRQLGLPTCECWRIIAGLQNFHLKIPNFWKFCVETI